MNPVSAVGVAIRKSGANELALALQQSRHDTLATFDAAWAAAQGQVAQRGDLNPPLWELGHIGWFQAWWLARNPARAQGWRADPDVARPASAGDALYDSSRVAHASRWQLPLPDADATRRVLAAQLDATLALLQAAPATDDGLYFFRLALLHEDMHHEAALYMAQALGWPATGAQPPRLAPPRMPPPPAGLVLAAGGFVQGQAGAGFAFDNECGAHTVALPALQIDAQVLRWAEYLPFVEAGGYRQPAWWDAGGLAWRAANLPEAPRYLRRAAGGAWQRCLHGQWQALPLDSPACHLSAHEAEAWCRWAGRRLPSEAEWERVALAEPEAFDWGAVWEWTASPFVAYPGFVAHPYRDYSAPWFGSRRVLRGASFMTQPRMHHPRYRNFFAPDRTDVAAGFRTCAL